jgi:hypothetical protein
VTDPSDAIVALEKLRALLDATRAQVNVALEELARIPAPPRLEFRCSSCGIVKHSEDALAEHAWNVHRVEAPAAS